MVRLLQNFDGFTLAQSEAAPAGSLPPPEWKSLPGRQATEKIVPQAAAVLFSKVSIALAHLITF